MKAIRNGIIGLSICTIAACTGNTKNTAGATNAAQDTGTSGLAVTQGKALSPNDWRFYDVEQQTVCIPVSWAPANQHQFLFFTDLNKISRGAYFIVLKRKATPHFNSGNGLKEAYQSLLKDTSGIVTSANVFNLEYQDKQVYSGEIHTSGTNISYTNYITIFEKYNEVFEIAMKIEDSKIDKYKVIYKNILFNFYSHDKLIFNATDKIKSSEKVDLEAL